MRDAEGSTSDRLMHFTRQTVTDFNRLLKIRPIVYEFYAIAFRQKKVRAVLKEYFRHFMEILIPIFQQGIDRGEFRKINAADAAVAVSAVIEGTFLLWVYDPDSIEIDRHATNAMQILLDGLKSQA
jgi:AcrR family transcriptional regulator